MAELNGRELLLAAIQGEKGEKGDRGDIGYIFTPSVSSAGVLSWTNNGGIVNPTAVNIKGADGKDGTNGSDGVSATHRWEGTKLYVTSASGTTSADLKGEDGQDGQDGKSPSFKLENGTIYGSYNDGQTWTPLGYVQGADGKDGTQVVANNGEATTEELSTLKVGDTNYSLPSGGVKLYRHTIKFHKNTDADIILTMEFLSSQNAEYCERRIGEIGNLFPNSPIKLENKPSADEHFGTLSIKLVPNNTNSIYIQGPYLYDYSLSRYSVEFNYSNTVIDSYNISEV